MPEGITAVIRGSRAPQEVMIVGRPVIERGVPEGEIMLLREINARARRIWFQHPRRIEVDWASMQPGESVFLPGYTANVADRDPAMRIFGPRVGMSNANQKVWTVRSTVEDGVKGVRVHRVA